MDPKEQIRLDTEATMRESYDLRVLVVGGGFLYQKMFYDAGFKGARSLEDCDIVCFTGGEDVDPALYKEKPLPATYFRRERDDYDTKIYEAALGRQLPMVGICRGSQFLTVMQPGGRLWQDVNNHAIRGGHSVIDVRTGKEYRDMTSTHHQQMIPPKGAEILALAELSTRKECEKSKVNRKVPKLDDVEAVWYPNTLCLAFQPHPEFSHGECRNYFLELVDEFILPAC